MKTLSIRTSLHGMMMKMMKEHFSMIHFQIFFRNIPNYQSMMLVPNGKCLIIDGGDKKLKNLIL